MGISELKLLLDITGDTRDELLALCLKMAETEILNYCNIGELPEALESVKLQMAADAYKSKYADTSGVTSIKEGDISITYGGTDTATDTAAIAKYKSSLNRFRRLFP